MTSQHSLQSAYTYCARLARQHYENFPVASLLLPRPLRQPVTVIYAFARIADDLADEGPGGIHERLAALEDYKSKLAETVAGRPPEEPVFLALADVLAHHHLPPQLFFDLLSAFTQDVTQTRYRDFAEALDYCRRSANPIGRLLLHLSGNATAQNLHDSDLICSALQLINFLQDIRQDLEENDRLYIPLDELVEFDVTVEDLRAGRDDDAVCQLIKHQLERMRTMMEQGAALGGRLQGRFGLEIRLIIQGGLAVLEKLERRDSPYGRPRLGHGELLWLLLTSLW